MSHTYFRGIGATGLLILPLAVLLTGCTPTPPPTAVLAGTWKVTTPSSNQLTTLLLTFDSNGNLDAVTYQVGNNVTITSSNPVGTTAVNGSDVTISSTFDGNGLTFNGTLNSDNSEIAGNLTTQISVGGLVVTIDNGPALLTKQ